MKMHVPVVLTPAVGGVIRHVISSVSVVVRTGASVHVVDLVQHS